MPDTKAGKVFLDDYPNGRPRESLNFIHEDLIRRELLLFLMNSDSVANHLSMLRSFKPLDVDPALTRSIVRYIINDVPKAAGQVVGEVEAQYHEVHDVSERLKMLEAMT